MGLIAVTGIVAFAAGFLLLWSAGSWLMGGGGFPGGGQEELVTAPVALQVKGDYEIEPLVDLRELRDLSYVPVKGIYMTSYAASSPEMLDKMIGLADRTEINAFVIDVKDDLGTVAYDADVDLAKQEGLIEKRIKDIDALIAKLREHNITPIARVVCFKDDILASKRPDLAVMHENGEIWQDFKELSFTNPYNHEVWEYLVQVAEDAARHGFREIQFDYVRFPSDGKISEAVYPGENSSKEDAIAAFLAYARPRLEKLGVWVSADVFGITVNPEQCEGLGDDRPERAEDQPERRHRLSDDLSLALPGRFLRHRQSQREPLRAHHCRHQDTRTQLAGTGAMGRPWLQDFSLRGVNYGVAEVKAQIKAAEEQGFSEWILWDPSLKYVEGALRSQES